MKWRRSALWCLTLTTVCAVFITTIPVGKTLMMKLENRFPMQNIDFKKVEGIIVLGGIVDQHLSKDRVDIIERSRANCGKSIVLGQNQQI